jgi:drug/metabolite transporter (DMT)-like permease
VKTSVTDIAIRAAPMTFVLLWCTGFISAKYGMPYAEPLTFLFARMGLVVLVLAAIVAVMRVPLPGPVDAWHSLVAGFLLQSLYLGGVFVALSQGVPAGISALIPGLQPILTATLAGRFLGERVTPVQWGGFALGLVGVLLVLNDRNVSMTGTPIGWTASVISLLGITLGTLYQKRYCGGIDLRSATVLQNASAGAAMLVCALLFEPMRVVWTGEFLFALLWLCLVLSVGATILLLWLIRRGAAARVASLFYLVPPVTAFMAFLRFGETLGLAALGGMVLTMAGVALVNRG